MHTSPVFGARLAINILSTLAYLMTLSQLFDKYMTSSQVWHTLTAMPQYAQLYKLRLSLGYSYSIEKKNGWETGCKFRINCPTFWTENEYILIINVEKVYAKFIPTHLGIKLTE